MGGRDRFTFVLVTVTHPAAEFSNPEDLGLMFPECRLSPGVAVLSFYSFEGCKQITVFGSWHN